MATVPWNGDSVTIVKADKGAALSIRRTKQGDNPKLIFTPDQLESLYATLAGAEMPVLSNNFALYGKEKKANGSPKSIFAEITRQYESNGETREAGHAYTAKQLDKFVPVSFALVTKFQKVANGRNVPQPLLLCYATPYERTGGNTLDIKRVNVSERKVKPESDEPDITRRSK